MKGRRFRYRVFFISDQETDPILVVGHPGPGDQKFAEENGSEKQLYRRSGVDYCQGVAPMNDLELVLKMEAWALVASQVLKAVDPWTENLNRERKLALGGLELWIPRLKASWHLQPLTHFLLLLYRDEEGQHGSR